MTRTLLGRSLSPFSPPPAAKFRRLFRPFCCDMLGAASSAVAAASSAALTCFLTERAFSSSSSPDVLRRFLLCDVFRGLSADSGGVGSQSPRSGLGGLRDRSGVATVFLGPTLESKSLSPLPFSSSSLSLSSSDVASSSSSSVFNSAFRFSLISGGVCPIGHSSAAPWYIHGSSAYLFCDNCISMHFKFGYEFFVEVFLEYRCARARDEVGALSGNNVEEVLQISHCCQFDGPQCKPESKEGAHLL